MSTHCVLGNVLCIEDTTEQKKFWHSSHFHGAYCLVGKTDINQTIKNINTHLW